MQHSIKGTVGSRGAVQANLVTDMDAGTSTVRVCIAITTDVPTAMTPDVERKWERLTDLRDEFDERLKQILLPPNA